MTHSFYVYGSYGFAVVLVAAVIGWTWLDGRLRRRELAELEAAGIRRRSTPKGAAQ
ncbi:heme exporter protein CcmD [Rhizobium sp. RAF56]|jgi:heme exporter protein D|uniref:heme exporter protein CcmD n=1 Tax=Rhizobium sp. RAF56 TaxID=3233062 RepID=UPI003F9B6AB9